MTVSPTRPAVIYRALVVLLLGLVHVPGPVQAQEDFFVEANLRYQEGDYAAALDRYLAILDAGFESGPLYYNIGNVYFKLGDLGRAILFYERASRLSHNDDDVQANLDLARSLTADEIEPLPGFWVFRVVSWWVHLVPRFWLLLLVLGGYLISAGAAVLWVLRRGTALGDWGARVSLAFALVALVFGVNLAARDLEVGMPEEAVVLADEVAVQSAPSDDSALQIFAIHQGTKVRIDTRAEDWVEIVLEDGKVGWVPISALEVI